MQLKKKFFQIVICFALSLTSAKAEYYYGMPGKDALIVARALQDLENHITSAFEPEKKAILLKQVYKAIEIDQAASITNKLRLLDVYSQMMKEYNISEDVAIAMFNDNDPRFNKIYHRMRKNLLLESISRIRGSIDYLKLGAVWSEVVNENNLKLLDFLKEIACHIPRDFDGSKADEQTINSVLKKAIDHEKAAMDEAQKKRDKTKVKIKSQLKDALNKVIKSKNTKPMEEIIIKNYGVSQEEAKAIILRHDDRAYKVLQDLILNAKK